MTGAPAKHLYISNTEKSKRKQFFETFDAFAENLLDTNVSPIPDKSIKTAGSYKFIDVLSLDVYDNDAAQKIAGAVREAYTALTEIRSE